MEKFTLYIEWPS